MRSLIDALTTSVLILAFNAIVATAQPAAGNSAINNGIAWDATEKSLTAERGAESAEFVFSFTNIAIGDKIVRVTNNVVGTNYTVVRNRSFWKVVSGDKYSTIPELVTNARVTTYIYQGSALPVTILSIKPSSGCKTENLSAQPWVLSPGATGEIRASVKLSGESGTVLKTIAISTDHGSTDLKLRVNMPAALPSSAAPVQPNASQQYGGSWTFDQSDGNIVPDTSGNGHDATVVGDHPNWVKSTRPDGRGLQLDGTNCAEVSDAVINTAESFTVSAWVSLNAIEARKHQTFVSIDGRYLSGFYLQMNPFSSGGKGRFEFDRISSDSRSGTKAAARAKSSASTNTWYHLVGVYDAAAQSLSLYLDGNLQDTVPYTGTWQANGKTAIGRGRSAGRNVDYVNGTIRDVHLYASALTADQVKAMAD